nr:MAG TPA: hypothetical protein [Caudoviricetes sp.]
MAVNFCSFRTIKWSWIHSWAYSWVSFSGYVHTPLMPYFVLKMAFFWR